MATVLHPLDPLTADEIEQSVQLIKSELKTTNFIYNSITLKEPPKSVLLPYLDGAYESEIPRKALTILIDKSCGKVKEVVVNISAGTVESIVELPPGKQPTLTPEDCFDAERIAKADETVKERCRLLGNENMDLVVADPW